MDEQTLNAIKNNLANMAANGAPASASSEPEEKGILDSMVDSVKGVFEDASEWMAERADYVDARDTVALEEYKRHKVSDNINAIANNNDSIFQPLGQAMQQSETVYKYIMDDSAKIAQARNIQKDIGIPVNVTLSDSTTWKRANAIYQENLENKKLSADNGGQWSIYDIYKAHPEIKTITDSDPAAGVLILKDMASARKEMNIIEGFTQYLNMGNKELELNNLRYKSYTAPSKMTDNDRQRMQDLEQQLDSEKKLYDVKFRDNPLFYALSGVGQSLPEMWQSIHTGLEDAAGWYQMSIWAGAGAGATVGSVAGPAGTAAGAGIGGTVAAAASTVKGVAKAVTAHEARQAILKKAAQRALAPNLSTQMAKGGMYLGSFRGMAVPEIGNRFAEYQNLTDKNGISLMSKDEAWSKAFFAGSVNAALEVVPTGGVLSKIAKPGTVTEKVVAKNTAKAQLGADIGKGTQKLFVNTLKVTGTESFEEGTQQAADDLVKNQIKDSHGGNVYRKGHGDKYYDINLVSEGKSMTAREILEDSANAALAAVPSSMVFGLGGAIGGGAVSGGRYALRQKHLLKNETDAEKLARHTYTGVVMAEQLQDAVQNSELQKTAPDVQAQLIREKAKGTGFETIYIDTEMALKKENGQQDLEALAKAAGIDEDALQTAVETKGTIAVPLESFAQSEASTELLESASFDTAADSMARMRENAKYTMEKMQENAERLVEQQMGLVESIPKELFPEDTEEAQANREIVEAAILRDIDNPARGLNKLIADVEANIMEILQPALNYLEDTSGNGVSIVDIGEGHTIRVSENARWYQDFYKAHKRKPTKGELMDIAADMVGGKSNIEYWAVQNAEEAKAASEIGAELERLNKKLDALNGVKEKMKGINSTEIKIAESMSPEGYKVYRKYADILQGAPGLASRAARVNAVLFAHMMERLAENTRRATGKPNYTAMDAADKIMLQMGGRQANVNSLDQAMFDVSGKGVSSLNGFMLKILEKEAEGTEASKIKWFDKNTGVTYPGAQVKHAILKHDLADEDLDNIQTGINKLYDVYLSKQKKGRFRGKAIFGRMDNGGSSYYVSLEMRNDGNVVFLTAAKTNDGLYNGYKKEHGSARLNSQSEPVPNSNHVLSIPKIQELMGIVKNGKENYSQMAGENAKTAALDKLPQAKEMLEAGEIESDIYKKTGWLRGFDGKWRFEIPDNLDKVDFESLIKHGETELGEIYDNPALYEAYPWLKEVSVAMETMGKKRRGYADSLGISLNAALLKDKEKAHENLATTLIHEIQHLIQKKEGFAAGGGPETVVHQVKNELKKVNESMLKANPSLIKQYWENQTKLNKLADDGNFGEEYEAAENQNEQLLNSIAEGVGLDVEDTQYLLNRKRDLEEVLKKVENASDKEKAEFELYQSLAGEREARYAEDRAAGKITREPDAYEVQGYDAVIVFDGKAFNAEADGRIYKKPIEEVTIKSNKRLKRPITDSVNKFAKEHPDGISVKTAIGEVAITKKSIRDSLSHRCAPKKIAVIPTLENGLLYAEPVQTLLDYDNAQKNNHYFVYPVSIDGEENFVLCRVVEQDSEKRLYVHEVANREEIIEKSDSLKTRAAANESNPTPRGVALYTSILMDYLEKIKKNEVKEQQETFNQIAWHGSPYDFDNFDLGAIDSGEGRQVHGWGLYFAEDEKTSQKFNQGIKGQTSTTANGQYIVSLFEKADESTFMHEMAHMYLLELEKLAFMDEQCKKDFDTIMEWATYKNGDEKHYRKTPFAKEFGKIAADMRSAKKSGDKEKVEKLKRQWAHERFARGFEMYLEHGTAPSKALQSAFRRFKQFLKTIYIAFTGDGARANAKVERVMARMLASDEEIEAMALDDRYKDITKAGGEKLLNESQKETYQRWLQEAREEAKEKLMKIMMKDLEEENQRKYQEALDTEKARKRAELEEQPLYVAQKIVEESGDKNTIVELNIYPSVEVYEAELKDKGTLQTNLEEYMKWYAESIDQQKVDTHTTQEKLEKMMEQSVYHKKLLAFEAAALREKEMLAQKINSKAKEAIDEVSNTIGNFKDRADEENVKKLVKAVNKLRFSSRWTAQELESIDNILKQSNKEEMKKALEAFTKEATSWQQNLKTIEDAFKGRMSIVKEMARSNLMNRSIAESCERTRYVVSEKKAASDMQRLVRAGKWDEAMLQQETRVTSAALAEEAEKNRTKVDKILDKVKKQLTAKTVKLPAEERYWINKLAYDLRLDKNWQKDLGRPTGGSLHLVSEEPTRPENCRELKEIFEELKNTLEVQEDMLDALSYIYQSGFTDYRALTMRQFEACTNIITVLYKTGRDKFQLKSFDGKLLSDVVDEIVNDTDSEGRPIETPTVNQKKINDDAGGIGYNDFFAKIPGLGPTISEYGSKYLTAHMKPEELIKLLGDKAHKYLYNLYDRAAGERGKRTAESIKKLQEIMSVYSRKEKQNMSKQVYELRTGAGVEKLSKENVICMALNMGTDKNFVRMYKGLGIDGLSTQRFIETNMTKKDWETVQKLWDYIGSFWPETVKVEEELNGVTPEGVEPRDFTVMCEGEPLKMKGGYYPISYNPAKSTKAEQQTMDAVTQRSMTGAQVLGTGMGSTKARSETDNIERPLLLQFNVITEHLQDVIKIITFRIAARDAYRLTHAKGFEEYVRGTLGNEALKSINQWVIDCWKMLPNDTDQGTSLFSRSLGFLRRNAAINIMGYRLWPVVENVTNLFPMMDRIGAVNTISALGDYMAHQKENDKLLLKSVFMTNRINSMDRDISMMPGIFEAGYKATDWLKEHAYTALTFTDLMFSKPLWCRTYKDSFAKNFQAVLKEENQKKVNMDEALQKIVDLQKRIMPLNKELYAAQNELKDVMNDVASGRSNQRMLIEKQNSVAQKESALKPLRRELWEAEMEVDRLSKIPAKTQAEITAEAEKRSAQEADAAVRSVFGSGQTKDLAAVQKGGEFLKLFTAFYSFFNTQANAILASYYKGKFRRDELAGANGLRRWMPFAKSVFYRIILTSAMATIMKMALLGDGNDDKHKYRKVKNADGTEIEEEIPLLERFLTQFAKNTVSTASGTAVGLRDIVGLYSNLVFEGTDYGRGASIGSIGMSVIDKLTQAFKLASQQEEKNARIEEQELKRQARYDKMTPAAKKKFDENLKYRKPVHKTTYADIGKSLTQAVTSVTAGRTGITDSMGNAVMTTLQYMTDGDGCYDKTLSNMAWSAIWNKKPVAVEVPKKPPQEKKKKKGAK